MTIKSILLFLVSNNCLISCENFIKIIYCNHNFIQFFYIKVYEGICVQCKMRRFIEKCRIYTMKS